ncbi:DUF1382 family protein [Modicisalibacter coralii]|uniref:DUF1382 family protein n=1 Tax=Modicisalibacter coralii TaxID=2304602 RepID=UPI00100AC04F|nr:DUF1382 family protein [Halomonas coralii]
MNRAKPTDLRTSLKIAQEYSKAGIGFVPMPVFSEEERQQRIIEAANRLNAELERTGGNHG